MAADRASSQAYDMPEATIGKNGAIDHVAHVDDIGALLCRLVGVESLDSQVGESRSRRPTDPA